MARQLFEVEKGLLIGPENDDGQVALLFGATAPAGTAEENAAAKGSLYLRTATGQLYSKTNDAGGPSDWELSSSGITPAFSNKVIRAVTNQTGISGGNTDPTAWTDNDGAVDGNDFAVGECFIVSAAVNPIILEVTQVNSATSIDYSVVSPVLQQNDGFVAQHYLPDPVNQENKALIVFSGTAIVKLADVDWDFATGINLSGSFSPTVNGTVSSADSVETALEKLSGNQLDLTTLSGMAQGSINNGSFTGTTIADNRTTKEALQDLETAHEEVDQNVDDLITLSGRPENSTNHGIMGQGDILSDNATTDALLREVDTELTRQRGKVQSLGVTTSAVIDSVLVDEVANVEWHITIEQQGAPANKRHLVLFAGHNGHASADATSVDDTAFAKLKQGANFDENLSVDIDGSGGTQTMRLIASSTETGGVNIYAKRIETLF